MQQRILTWILSLSSLFLLLAGFIHPITAYTQDLGRHILLGKLILQMQHVPTTNLLSYTYPAFPFINHHYLSEVIYYLTKQTFGDTGLLLTSVFIVTLSCGATVVFSLKKAHVIPTTILAIVYTRILFERTDIRPEQLGYFLFVIFLLTLYQFRKKVNKKIYFLIPLSFVWVQLHISFIFGLFLIGLFFLDSLYTSYKQHDFSTSRKLLLLLISCGVISLLNPNGLEGAFYPLRVFQNYGYTIQENQTIFLLDEIAPTPSITYFKIAALILFVSLLSRFKYTRPIDWLLALSFTFLAASAIRNFPFFVFATFIPASLYLSHIYSLLINSIRKPYLVSYITMLSACLLLLITFFQVSTVITQKPLGIHVAKGAERGVDFFIANKLTGPIFNNFDIGSYLAYRLYPQEKIFIDGRPEAYPAEFIQKIYIPMQQDPTLFENVAKQYGFTTIFFAHNDQTPWANEFLKTILRNPNWSVLYLDETTIILAKRTKQHTAVIARYGMEIPKLTVSNMDDKDFLSLLKVASFFNKTGLSEQEIPFDEKLLNINPKYCPALYNLAMYHTQKQNTLAATGYQQRFLLHCN